MTRKPEVQAIVDALVGTWSGRGDGGYPTIDPFEYREVTRITDRPDHPALHYEQRAWRITPEGEAVSHWETGLLRISGDGTVTLHNAQGGRSESMAGTWIGGDESWAIDLAGTGYSGDQRMLGTKRTIEVNNSTLHYVMHMETLATHQMLLHLEARLHKNR